MAVLSNLPQYPEPEESLPVALRRAPLPWLPCSLEEDHALREDLSENGQQRPILIDEHGQVWDGWRRYQALLQLGKEPWTEKVSNGVQTAIGAIVHRHMNAIDRARFVVWLWSHISTPNQAGKRSELMAEYVQNRLGWSFGASPRTMERLFILGSIPDDQAAILRHDAGDLSVSQLLMRLRAMRVAAQDHMTVDGAGAPVQGSATAEAVNQEPQPTGARQDEADERRRRTRTHRTIVRTGAALRAALVEVDGADLAEDAREMLRSLAPLLMRLLDISPDDPEAPANEPQA